MTSITPHARAGGHNPAHQARIALARESPRARGEDEVSPTTPPLGQSFLSQQTRHPTAEKQSNMNSCSRRSFLKASSAIAATSLIGIDSLSAATLKQPVG